MLMKKIAVCALLAAAMTLTSAACGENKNEAETSNGTETSNEEGKEEMEMVEIESGGEAIRVEHHDRTIYADAYIPDNWNNTNYPIDRYPTLESIHEVIDFWGVKLGCNFVYTMRDLDIFANMADFKKTVLILHGTTDAIVPLSSSQRAVNTYPDAELVVYEGEGHGFTPVTMRDLKKRLLEFINDNP